MINKLTFSVYNYKLIIHGMHYNARSYNNYNKMVQYKLNVNVKIYHLQQ